MKIIKRQIEDTLRQLLAAATVVLLAGASSPAMSQAPAGSEKEVVFAFYGGTLEQLARNDLIPAFEKATGIKVRMVIGTSQSNFTKVLATKAAPEIDVVSLSEVTHIAGKQLGLLEKLDPAIVSNMKDLRDEVRDPDDIGGAIYVMATGIEYNPKALAAAGIPKPTSWNDLWDPRFKGKVALQSFNVSYTQDFLAIINRLAGGTESDITPGLKRIKELKVSGNLAMFASSPAELDNMLVQGQAWVGVSGSARGFILKEKGAPIDFAYPKEGAGFYTSYFDVVKNAPHPKAAQAMVNFLLGSQAQLLIARGAVAAPINRTVELPAQLAAMVPSSEQIKTLVKLDRSEMNRQLDKWASDWNREIESN